MTQVRLTPRAQWRTALTDGLLVVWVLAWVLLGRAVHQLVVALAGPARSLQGAGSQFETSVRGASDQLRELPLIGAPVQGAFEKIAGTGNTVASAGDRMASTIEQLGLVLGLVVAAGPTLLAVLPWAVWRFRQARQRRAVERLTQGGAGLDLFALRALATQPVHRLASISPDPVGAWRQADPAVTQRLAALELRGHGVLSVGAATVEP